MEPMGQGDRPTNMDLIRRTVAVVGVLLAVTTAFVAGLGLSPGHHDRGPRLLLSGQDLGRGLSCEQLRQWYVDHALDQVTAWGWQGPPIYAAEGAPTGTGAGVAEPQAQSAGGTTPDSTTTSATGTNVQEAGVDEPDVVKTEPGLLVRVAGGRLLTYDVSGARPQVLGSASLPGMSGTRLLLDGNRVVAIGDAAAPLTAGTTVGARPPATAVRTFDLSDPRHPRAIDARRYDGSLVSARQTGGVVRLVLSSGPPALDFTQPSSTQDEAAALAHNRAVVRASTLRDWLPTVSYGDPASTARTTTSLVGCADVAVPDTFAGLGTMSVVGFRAQDPGGASVTAVATGSEVAYLAPGHLYVAATPSWRSPTCCAVAEPATSAARTQLYAFDLTGTSAQYVGAGSVAGYVSGSAAMDEHQGVLRVAVGPTVGRASSSVVLFRPESGALAEIGRLDGLGVGQQLRAVRWFDRTAVLVTFRQVDPFYVVDLADPTRPQVLGSLHLPGWSTYLHPVGPHLVLGLGQTAQALWRVDVPPVPAPSGRPPAPPSLPPNPSIPPMPIRPTTGPVPPGVLPTVPDVSIVPDAATATAVPAPPSGGGVGHLVPMPAEHAKATLFDIADPAHPRALGTVRYPAGSIARAGVEPHQVTWLPGSRTLLTVVSRGYGPDAWISVLTLGGGTLHDRLVPVPSTPDVNDVRTVPLSDGRVVLVAGDTVRFLDL